MKKNMDARSRLIKLLEAQEPTAGTYVRIHGNHLIIGRQERFGSNAELENDDRIRLTQLSSSRYELSVKRHTGRWERTPFSGTADEMLQVILECMQHLVAPYSPCTGASEP
jgi:hypothetical protein